MLAALAGRWCRALLTPYPSMIGQADTGTLAGRRDQSTIRMSAPIELYSNTFQVLRRTSIAGQHM
jgi:hypothetical protein